MALTSISLLLLIEREKNSRDRWRLAILTMIVASGTGVTKQPGLYILAWTTVFVYFQIFHTLKFATLKKEWKRILVLAVIPLIITVPWYAYVLLETFTGGTKLHFAEAVADSNNASDSKNVFLTMIAAIQSLEIYRWLLMFLLPSVFLMDKFWRKITLSITIPYVILWAAVASYDTRNLTLAFPLIALACGLGFDTLVNWGMKRISRLKVHTIPLWGIILLLLLIPISLSFVWQANELEQQQEFLQKQIFDPALNRAIYETLEGLPEDTVIFTRYPMEFLPNMKFDLITSMFRDEEDFHQIIQENPEIDYILKPTTTKPGIDIWISEQIANGRLIEVFSVEGVIPYRLYQFQDE
jgi:hypothetical protein